MGWGGCGQATTEENAFLAGEEDGLYLLVVSHPSIYFIPKRVSRESTQPQGTHTAVRVGVYILLREVYAPKGLKKLNRGQFARPLSPHPHRRLIQAVAKREHEEAAKGMKAISANVLNDCSTAATFRACGEDARAEERGRTGEWNKSIRGREGWTSFKIAPVNCVRAQKHENTRTLRDNHPMRGESVLHLKAHTA